MVSFRVRSCPRKPSPNSSGDPSSPPSWATIWRRSGATRAITPSRRSRESEAKSRPRWAVAAPTWSATVFLSMASSVRPISNRPTSGPIAAATPSWLSRSAWSRAATLAGPSEPPSGRRLLSFARAFISGFNSGTVAKGSRGRGKLVRAALHRSARPSGPQCSLRKSRRAGSTSRGRPSVGLPNQAWGSSAGPKGSRSGELLRSLCRSSTSSVANGGRRLVSTATEVAMFATVRWSSTISAVDI